MPEISARQSDAAVRRRSLKNLHIHGISSMIRDLDWMADSFTDLEAAVLANHPLETHLSPSLELRSGSSLTIRVGDVVLFRPMEEGPYRDMETTWGGRVALVPGHLYIGVMCERCSTKFFTASFSGKQFSYEKLVLQFVAQAGGIGYCTGCSPSLRQQTGFGRAANVEVLGILYDRSRCAYLNTLSISGLLSCEPPPPRAVPPTLLIVGTATDVGKTTLACSLLQEISKTFCAVAIKASGTAWYEDSQLHAKSGAAWTLNFSFAGLPTTYYVDSAIYRRAIYSLYHYVCAPECIPAHKRAPEARNQKMPQTEVLVVEHGGDILGADVPVFFEDSYLVDPVKILIICCESALALLGTLNELQERGIDSSRTRIYAAMPLINPHAFLERVGPLTERGLLHGVIDIHKPESTPEHGWRREYTSRHSEIMTVKDMASVLAAIIKEERRRHTSPAVAGL
jgi:hypothetical protein